MAADDEVIVYRPPDRLLRVGLAVCATTVATGPLLVIVLLLRSVPGALALSAALLAAALLCLRMTREHCAVSADGIADHRTFRCVSCAWTDVAAVAVANPGGPWGGLCVRVHLRHGVPIALLGTRRYSYTEASEGVQALTTAHDMIERRLVRNTLSTTRTTDG